MYLIARRSPRGIELALTGRWRIGQFLDIDRELAALDFAGVREVLVATDALETLDLSSGWLLREHLERARAAGAVVSFRGEPPSQLKLIDASLAGTPLPPAATEESPLAIIEEPVEALGRHIVRGWRDSVSGLAFLGQLTVTAIKSLPRLRHLRPTAVARHAFDTGVTAVPIVSLIAFLISVIIAYIGAEQLARFGAVIFVVDLVTIGVLRELGVLLTAIILAGRSGSAFAAEIGAMQLNEEVDALNATGVSPLEVLVLPRVLGLTIALPLLTIVADLVGLAGGAVLCRAVLHIPLSQYLVRVREAISATTFWVGVIKAPVFAILIGAAGTLRGMQVSGSSRELGRLTTMAVVQAIFLVILADAIFAIVFMELDI